ncbi:hypothetical protein M441DRAFT_148102 [Trichoderma asperellum CBS 433.97]|uniref:Uncharacterized protein n=1 Tax=Trichoderma asperellum (strain ATCC 204424 / CBS 433.97 / NBRC 101777) TaxID=1042311 RepID=A0A2T3YYZ7_TRIA4|nr:hypothetical protein M441DRAFT_148102 [Trichoderma asperellum CBS 433.97]PTB37793.1 hypothetical protein M441DRAFT_148102 [Trichoderma asperellum CBS 433.97]
MPVQAIGLGTAPPNLTIANITVPHNIWVYSPFIKGSSSYEDALACLRMYRKQVTQLNHDQRLEIIQIITEGRFFRTRTAMKSATGHMFYRYAREKGFAPEHLSWPEYIVMHALYKGDLPPQYVSPIEKAFGTTAIEDFSYYPREIDGSISKPSIPKPKVSIGNSIPTPVPSLPSTQDKADGNEAGTKDDVLPAAKRQKTSPGIKTKQTLDTPTTVQQTPRATPMDQAAKDTENGALASIEEATQQQKFTTAPYSVTTPRTTPPINLDIRDILDRLPPKSSPKTEWVQRRHSRLEALEESHRDLTSKLDVMTTAFDATNTTIETIIIEVRADREGYNHVSGSIKDMVMGMADSIKDIKEQL